MEQSHHTPGHTSTRAHRRAPAVVGAPAVVRTPAPVVAPAAGDVPRNSPEVPVGQPGDSLQTFTLADLAPFTKEHTYSTLASNNFHLFYVGRDDVHSILRYVLSRVSVSLYLNMFGYDDPELNNILFEKVLDPSILMLITLDKQQAGSSEHEKRLIALDQKESLSKFNTHFVIGQSKTHQISHTKGFVADGKVAGEGSTNWSASGEGIFVVAGQAGGPKYKAQNNTQSIITDIDTVSRFQSELIAEHMLAQKAARETADETREKTGSHK
jgi:hypothetical protein